MQLILLVPGDDGSHRVREQGGSCEESVTRWSSEPAGRRSCSRSPRPLHARTEGRNKRAKMAWIPGQKVRVLSLCKQSWRPEGLSTSRAQVQMRGNAAPHASE